jgi:hypothetical protein
MALQHDHILRNAHRSHVKRISEQKSKVKEMVETYEERMNLKKDAEFVRKVIMSCHNYLQIEACSNMVKNLNKQYKGKVPATALEDIEIGLNTAIRVLRNQLPQPDPGRYFGVQYGS